MLLNFLHLNQELLAIQGQVNESLLGVTDDQEEVVAGQIHMDRVTLRTVDHAGNLACATSATGSALTKFVADFRNQCRVAHQSLLQSCIPRTDARNPRGHIP